MSYELNITLTPASLELIRRWPTLAPVAMQKMAKALDLENELTIGYAQVNKLSGPRPGVLGVVTNRLRSSLRRSAATVDGTQLTGAIGTNVKYAGVHEFGFDGDVQVRPYVRRRIIARVGKRNKVTRGNVRGFTRHMRMPERSFIRCSISERLPNYNASLSKAIVSALGGTS